MQQAVHTLKFGQTEETVAAEKGINAIFLGIVSFKEEGLADLTLYHHFNLKNSRVLDWSCFFHLNQSTEALHIKMKKVFPTKRKLLLFTSLTNVGFQYLAGVGVQKHCNFSALSWKAKDQM